MKDLLAFSRVQTQVAKSAVIAFPSRKISSIADSESILEDSTAEGAAVRSGSSGGGGEAIRFAYIVINFEGVSDHGSRSMAVL